MDQLDYELQQIDFYDPKSISQYGFDPLIRFTIQMDPNFVEEYVDDVQQEQNNLRSCYFAHRDNSDQASINYLIMSKICVMRSIEIHTEFLNYLKACQVEYEK